MWNSFIIIFVVTSFIFIGFQNCSPFHSTSDNSSLGPSLDELLRASQDKASQILTNKCAHCHNPVDSTSDLIDILDFEQLKESGYIVIGEPQSSPLYLMVIDQIEPRDGEPLSDSDIATLRDWIALLGGNMNTVINPPQVDDDGNPIEPGKFSQVNQIVQNSCLNCHNNPANGRAGLRNYTEIRAQVVPGNAPASPLYQKIISGEMPPNNPLGATEIQIIGTWINSGAPNN